MDSITEFKNFQMMSQHKDPLMEDLESYSGSSHRFSPGSESQISSNSVQSEGSFYSSDRENYARTNTERLWREIHYTAQWGAIPGNLGMGRLSLSDEDRLVRDYFVRQATEIGCDVKVDQMGNIFAILAGENNSLPPIGIGSHLDTQPAGGRYDGILGVLAALEVLRTVKESGQLTYAPLAAINWTNEEGARFTPGCNGSAVWAGHYPITRAHNLADSEDRTMQQELQRIGYLGATPCSYLDNQLTCHVELHIEQRRILQDTRRSIGVVKNIQGIRWYSIRVDGKRGHAGSMPMDQRADAMVAASSMVLDITTRAREVDAVATVGVLELDRPSSNTIPGVATFTLDLRHPSEAELDSLEDGFRKYIEDLEDENCDYHVEIERIWHSPAVDLDKSLIACARHSAVNVVGADQVMDTRSLAGHDSALTAIRVPTAMIFVPCKDGISHAPEEFSSKEQCGIGAQVLLDTVLEYDKLLKHEAEA